MTPPLTGFFMRAAGLGQLHKEIEKQKRKREMARYNETRNRTPSVGHIDQSFKTRSPIGPVPRVTNGPPQSSRNVVRGTDGPPPFPRVHWKEISRETLAEYDLPWHWDINDRDYIIIDEHLTRHTLNQLIQHTARLREREERDLALRGSGMEAEQTRKPRESKERNEARLQSARRHRRDTESAAADDHDGGHAHVPQPGRHTRVSQIRTTQPPTPREASTAQSITQLPATSHHISQSSSKAPSMHSRLSRPFAPYDYTSKERPRHRSPQTPSTRSGSRAPQVTAELPATPARREKESYESRPRASSAQQGLRPNEGAPRRQGRNIPPPSEHVNVASPAHSASIARPRDERPRRGVEDARQFRSQYVSGPRYSRRERGLY